MNNVNLEAIRKEIDSRKKEVGIINEDGSKVKPRDLFLNDLVTAIKTKTPNRAVEKIKIVENASKGVSVGGNVSEGVSMAGTFESDGSVNTMLMSKSKSGVIDPYLLDNVETPQSNVKIKQPNNDTVVDSSLTKLRNQTQENLKKYYNQAGLINEYNTIGTIGNTAVPQYVNQPNQTGLINPNMLLEQINNATNNIVTSFMNENFSSIVQEALKNTIVEIYSVERVKKVLSENKDIIENAVIEVIKKLQERKKQQPTK